jgi:hypothetical protein
VGVFELVRASPPSYVGEVTASTKPRQGGDDAAAYVLRYSWSFDAALEAGRFFQARTFNVLSLAAVAGVLVGAVVTALYDGAIGFAIMGGSVALLIVVRFPLLDRFIGRRRVRHLLGAIVELRLKDDGIDFQGPIASGQIPWASITEMRTNARTVLFVGHRLLVAFAPAAAFGSEREKEEVIAYSLRRIEAARAPTAVHD